MWYSAIFGDSVWGAAAFYALLVSPAVAAHFFGGKRGLLVSIPIVIGWMQLVLLDQPWIGAGFYLIAWTAAVAAIVGGARDRRQH